MRRRILFIFALPMMLAAFVMAAPAALAASSHFINASATLSGTNLVVNFKEAGLGTNQLITYVLNADVTVTYVCINSGGANPSASNKTSVSESVGATGTFSSGTNGQITASITLSPPPPPSDFSCPHGQEQDLVRVDYRNVKMVDTTNDVTETIPGTFSTGCLLPDVRGACS